MQAVVDSLPMWLKITIGVVVLVLSGIATFFFCKYCGPCLCAACAGLVVGAIESEAKQAGQRQKDYQANLQRTFEWQAELQRREKL